MKKLRYSFLMLFFCSMFSLMAQDSLLIDFKLKSGAVITDSHFKRKDNNDNNCALLIISADGKISDYKFSAGGWNVDSVEYNTNKNCAYMFLIADMPSIPLEITPPAMSASRFTIPDALKGLQTYEMTLRIKRDFRDKTRTFIMPVVGVGSLMNYGAMIAIVKKYGFYAKFKYNFKSVDEESGTVTNEGLIDGTSDYAYLSDTGEKTRLSVSGGFVYRFWQEAVDASTRAWYAYIGAGYGYANNYWQDTDGKWLKNIDQSNSGVEVDLGVIYRHKTLSVTAGYETTGFKYHELCVGVGVAF